MFIEEINYLLLWMLFPPYGMFFVCSTYRNSSIHICFRKLSLILQWRITHPSAFPSYFNTSIIGRSYIPFVILILLFVFIYNNFFSHWTFNFWRISIGVLLIFYILTFFTMLGWISVWLDVWMDMSLLELHIWDHIWIGL